MAETPHFPPYHGFIDDDEARTGIILCSLFPALATLIVFLRLYLRRVQRISLGWDDFFIVVTMVIIWAVQATAVYTWHNGMGRKPTEVPLLNLRKYLQSLYAFELFYLADFGFCKVSILLFYQRVFAHTALRRTWIWSLLAFIVVWTFVFEAAFVVQCLPIHYFWTKIEDPAGGTCVNLQILYAIHATINVLTDLIIYVYPMPIVWKLNVSRMQKVGLLTCFAAGGLVCAFSLVRAAQIGSVISKNFTHDDQSSAIWALLELSTGCIAACLPTIRTVFLGCGPRVRRLNNNHKSSRSDRSTGRGARQHASGGKGSTFVLGSNTKVSVDYDHEMVEDEMHLGHAGEVGGAGGLPKDVIEVKKSYGVQSRSMYDPEHAIPLRKLREEGVLGAR